MKGPHSHLHRYSLTFWNIALYVAFVSTATAGMMPQHDLSPDTDTASVEFDHGQVFDEVSRHVAEKFYQKDFDQAAWMQRAAPFRQRAVAAQGLGQGRDQFAVIVNQLLETLNTSHTYYFSKQDPRRYQLLGIFHGLFEQDRHDLFLYDGIGIATQQIDNSHVITACFDGLPADRAGLRFGDTILSVNGEPFHPIQSFAGLAGKKCELRVQRESGADAISFQIDAVKLDGRTMFKDALRNSMRVIQRDNHKIGYLHVWSYAGSEYQEIIRQALLWGDLAQCDALVMDLRDGWGGADLNYVSLFRPAIMQVESTPRSGPTGSYSGVWGKPVSLITNQRSTSGKELFTLAFKKLKLGTVVGGTTAGAVVAGRCILLSNNDVLYLAVNDVHVDGIRLEGKGVDPDVQIPRPLQPATATDTQLETAVNGLLENLKKETTTNR